MGAPTIIRCSPPTQRHEWVWLFVCGGLFSAAFANSTPKNGGPSPVIAVFFYSLSALCLLGVALYLWWLFRAAVVGDADALHVRQFSGWKSVCWDEVLDYYESVPLMVQRSAQTSSGKVVPPLLVFSILTTGTKIEFTNRSSQAEALKALVTLHAVSSRAICWETFGTRAIDPWPRTFDYNTRGNRWAPRLWLKLFVAFVVYLFIQPALQLATTAQLIGWAPTLAVAGAYTLLVGSIGLVFLLPLAQYRAANRRKAERIIVSLDGIVFDGGARRVEAAWADVTGYHSESSQGLGSRFVVETRQGEFDFLSSLGSAALLQAIIQRFATDATDTEWRSRISLEALGGEAARWTGGKPGVGARVYHYRTRVNRAVLGLPLTLCLVFLLMAGLIWQGLLPGMNAQKLLLIGIASGAWFFLGCYAYCVRRIVCDDNGLTQRTVFSSRFLAWDQVQEFMFSRPHGGKVVGRTKTLSFDIDIVGCAELTAEIERRAKRTRTAN